MEHVVFVILSGVELFGQFEAQFSATVKVYSNGDASVDTFNYKIVESK